VILELTLPAIEAGEPPTENAKLPAAPRVSRIVCRNDRSGHDRFRNEIFIFKISQRKTPNSRIAKVESAIGAMNALR
jgi:hypothetical protein